MGVRSARFVLAALAAASLAACQPAPPPVAVRTSASPQADVHAPAELSPIIASPIPAQPAFPEPPPKFLVRGQRLNLADARMTTARVGWALDQFDQTRGAVLRTTDGGRHWRDVTPRGDYDLLIGGEWLDESHGWVGAGSWRGHAPGYGNAPGHLDVFRTVDGGRTWSEARLPGAMGISDVALNSMSIDFLDSHRGWAVPLIDFAGNHQIESALYGTVDGGLTWSRLAPAAPPPGVAGPAQFANRLDRVRFNSARDGWATGPSNPYSHVVLSRTSDGGLTWTDVRLPTPPGFAAPVDGCECWTDLPVFRDRLHGLVVLTGFFAGDAARNPHSFTFTTADGGTTWQGRDTPVAGDANAFFLTPMIGWLAYNGAQTDLPDGYSNAPWTLFRTSDGGHTWVRLNSTAAVAYGETRFRDTVHGSYLGPLPGQTRTALQVRTQNHLLLTSDGGRSWREVVPTL